MNDIECKGDFAEVLGEGSGEQFLDVWGVIDREDDDDSADGLSEAMGFRICLRSDSPQPPVEWRPFEANVGTGSEI